MKQNWIPLFVVLLLIASAPPWAEAAPEAPLAAISLTSGVPYAQDFNTLANSGTSTTVPDGWAFSESGSGVNATYAVGAGSSTAGDTYSFGAASAIDRAFGGLQSGSLIPTIGAEFQNGTGATIISLAVSYNCEEWRLGTASRVDQMDFQYSTDATSLATGAWTDVNTLDCLTTNTATTGAKDGNDAANRTSVSGNVTGLSIVSGATFWLRWSDFNATGSDDGLGVDDFEVTAQTPTAVTLRTLSAVSPSPAPASIAGLALLGGLAALMRRRKA